MLVSPKWQTMWMESQHCSKSIVNMPLPSQQAKKILEDLKTSCTSPNKAVQLEALRCWGIWINNQNPEHWKLNSVCYTAVRPLLTKKLQPLHKDVDICKLKLNLLWILIVKVQNIMQLEGPQYIFEVFLQSCLTWLSSSDGVDNEISLLIFQLLLAIFKKGESQSICDKELFSPLTTEILGSKKVFHIFADKFLNIFINWRKIEDKSIVLKIWKCFLKHCEQSCESIPIPIWHKIFKIVGQICSERSELIRERLGFLHGCATILKSVLCSSKFIDYGNLLTTPCEALLKKLIELCTVECEEFCDLEMFTLSREICLVLSDESIVIGGYDLCIFVLDLLEEFSLKSLFWGVWCGLVDCYKIRLRGIETNQFTKMQMKFYRKLRGVAVNYSLDKNYLHKDCLIEVEKRIEILNIDCLYKSDCVQKSEEVGSEEVGSPEAIEIEDDHPHGSERITALVPKSGLGKFSTVALYSKQNSRKTLEVLHLKFDLIKDVLMSVSVRSLKSLLEGVSYLRFISIKDGKPQDLLPKNHLEVEVSVENKKITVTSRKKKETSSICDVPLKTELVEAYRKENEKEVEEEEVISTPKTRSQRRAEERRREVDESQKRKKRKSFEVLVQEIVRKNKLRKTEKNTRKKKTVTESKKEKRDKKELAEKTEKEEMETPRRQLRNSKKEEAKWKKPGRNSTDGKLENYFKIITKKLVNEKKVEGKAPKGNKRKKKVESKCCSAENEESEKKEVGWKQTSLKTMMNKKNKAEKLKHGMKTRNKESATVERHPKLMKNFDGKSVVKLSPFKEVFHDHEYAKVEPSNLIALERMLNGKIEVKPEVKISSKVHRKEVSVKTELEHSSPGRRSLLKPSEMKVEVKSPIRKVSKQEKDLPQRKKTEKALPEAFMKQPEVIEGTKVPKQSKKKADHNKPVEAELKKPEEALVAEITPEVKPPEVKPLVEIKSTPEVSKQAEHSKAFLEKTKRPEEATPGPKKLENDLEFIPSVDEKIKVEGGERIKEGNENSDDSKEEKVKTEVENIKKEVIRPEESHEEFSEMRKGRKRIRMMDSLKPSKKIKIDFEGIGSEEKQPPLEVIEKENLETPLEENKFDSSTPTKENTFDEKVVSILKVKGDGSPKTVNGTISSRALRMIALVPESTKPGQVHWESSSKGEALKNKKGPNVDRNSRASKMLALLSGNIVAEDAMELDDVKLEELNCNGTSQQTTTPNIRTPTSTLKSPNSVKKRRSIRFDDAKNETVLYQTDTPPSQILEEKEKFRRIKLQEIIS